MFLNSAKKILVLVSERVGDAIFCTPAVALLKQQLPNAGITVLALAKSTAEVYAFNSDVSEILTAPTLTEFEKIRDHYDVLIDLHHSEKTMQYVNAWRKAAYINQRSSSSMHQSDVATRFIQSLLSCDISNFDAQYRLFPLSQHFEKIKLLLTQAGVDLNSAPILVGCHMGCYKTASRLRQFWKRKFISNKGWPVESFAEVQKLLYQKNPQAKLVLTGVPSENKLTKYMHTNVPNIINLIGKTSVLEMAALMTMLKVFLTGDTGPLHIAASTEVPIVALFGSTYPELTGPRPLKPQHHVIFKHPMEAITPQEAFDKVQKYL